MRKGLQITLYVLTIIPVVFGPLNFFFGAAMHMPSEYVTPNIDSHIRFQFTWFFGLALIFWYVIPKIEQHTTLFRIIILVMFVGGIARVFSIARVGMPDIPILAATAIELLLPLLLPWQAAVAKAHKKGRVSQGKRTKKKS